uniref:Uncharacterized protein n=1 Tax=Trichuris muris TaxID=70415 RepID=A0A5S6QQR2_TRIMR
MERLNGTQQRRRGRSQTKELWKIMEDAAKTICRESLFRVRKFKEALFIRHNTCQMNREKGVEVSELWTDLIYQTGAAT